VMPVTQQHHVLEGGGSAMGPVHDVVPVNPQMYVETRATW